MRIVTIRCLILNMRRRYRYPSRLLLWRLIYLIIRRKRRSPTLRQYLRYRRRQRRLSMVNMPYRSYIAMRLLPLKFLFRHRFSLLYSDFK